MTAATCPKCGEWVMGHVCGSRTAAMPPDESVQRALMLVTEAGDVLRAAEQAAVTDQRMRNLVMDAVQVVGEARGNLAVLLSEVKAVTP